MRVTRTPAELGPGARTVAIGSFDGVHLGHKRVLDTARAEGSPTAVVTFWPHPRLVLGNQVELLSSLERRLELFEQEGVNEVLVVEFTAELARQEPDEFADKILRPIGTSTIAVGENFRFGRGAAGTPEVLAELGFEVRAVPLVHDISSTRIRACLRAGEIEGAAKMLGRPPEVEGTVVPGFQRGGTLGFPTANLSTPPNLLVPANGIYAGATLGHRAAISIGVNPHYGGEERSIEPYLLDFEGDLYGRRLVVELWRRLRDEQAFDSEEALVAQIARDVEETRAAERPV